jgi:hypothetical protein
MEVVAMEILALSEERYLKIIEFICIYKGINKEELVKLLKDRESKYLLLLILETYRCADLERISRDFSKVSTKSLKYNLKKAEEKFFVNKEFRDRYLEIEEMIKKII